jgi:crossover junction endodeoxyribonuclease RuvC
MRVLGIDPGLRFTGYACLDDQGVTSTGERARILEAGVFRLGRGVPASGACARSVSDRLEELDRDFRELLARQRPEAVAVESIFAHSKHPATAIVMGHARGVLLLAVRQAGVRLLEFKPAVVKKGMTGHGAADKARMQRAVQACFGLAEPPSPPDVADAIAIAWCALRRVGLGLDVVDQHAGLGPLGRRKLGAVS